ncbi:helix-turn-helix domain-containing protein [Jiangella mangrovi]|uniref:Transcriptional regulator with XRE-family HTH domain n=1 Tax=Jiangella mangrovi TaxID=1524084 RepID=A0A7W9GKC7_9ACTN|nr:helix-turn-helix transcriptional regulator [Jiangella mangrovi]MBB5785449.1 transcriptional regulator with XRE-family HTH domain [Jiangella mangrovi]
MDVGALIKKARYEAGLSQGELAERAGVSRYAISHYECGVLLPSIPALRSILEATGKQLHAELEPLDADVRAAIARLAGAPMEDRPSARHWAWVHTFVGPAYRVEGVAAAELLGAPVPVDHLDLALADAPESYAVLVQQPGWSWPALSVRRDTWPFGWPKAGSNDDESRVADLGTRLRDLLREQCPDGVFWMASVGYRARVRLVPPAEVERYVEVATPHGVIRVAPLHEIESTDPRVTRVLRVLRETAETAVAPVGDTAGDTAVGLSG